MPMSGDTPPGSARPTADVAEAIQAREAGLGVVARANRWMVSAAVALAAGLTALTAHAFHARAATGTASAAASSASAATSSGATASSGDDSAPLQAPAAAPQPAPQVPVAPVVSGGS